MMTPSKDQLREQARRFRKSLSLSDITNRSQQIQKRTIEYLEGLDFVHIHIYEAIPTNYEVETQNLITWLQNRSNAAVYIQPTINSFPAIQFDVVIVPCLVADTLGNRIGYGGGGYDRFLATQEQAHKIGLIYHELLVERINNEPHDVPLNSIVSENQLIKCG